jgi:hypothetical protein
MVYPLHWFQCVDDSKISRDFQLTTLRIDGTQCKFIWSTLDLQSGEYPPHRQIQCSLKCGIAHKDNCSTEQVKVISLCHAV